MSILDMQIPTLLCGDFNGTINPSRDYTSGDAPVCGLLSHLLGPGGPLLDLQLVVSPTEFDFTFQASHMGHTKHSRCDLMLGNRAVLGIISRVYVAPGVVEGGHSPVVAELKGMSSLGLNWVCPKPKLPSLLLSSSAVLRSSEEWRGIVARWEASTAVQHLLARVSGESAQDISTLLDAALQHLVDLCGGWVRRPAVRRPAYDSPMVCKLRATLQTLGRCASLLRREMGPGAFSHRLDTALRELRRRGLEPPMLSKMELARWIGTQTAAARGDLVEQLRIMRAERVKRWKATIPQLWAHRSGKLYSWLKADTPAWGSLPILAPSGQQCTTLAEVDMQVKAFWVGQVWQMHAAVNPEERWAAFQASPFFRHIPSVHWPTSLWTAERVRTILGTMSEGSSPGPRGFPIALWKALPDSILQRVADLLSKVERDAVWPRELLHAYVTMIPKASGGSRPQDQRPITVLDILYRVWAKGTVLTWAPTLQGSFLGSTVMGFRAQAGTLHLVQLLGDLIELQKRHRKPLWLISFDVEKCFPSLPWWALFGVLQRAGVPAKLIACFQSFYLNLRQRFRYGHVEGSEWGTANGLAQGCPASPDLMNMLFEPFHRWAAAQGVGVAVLDSFIASASFADDIALVATSMAEVLLLVNGYQAWCNLLGVRLHLQKTQLWSLTGRAGEKVTLDLASGPLILETRATFRIVGVELGANEHVATAAHILGRLPKALLGGRRLAALDVPTAVAAQLWRTAILPQGLYGSEVRRISSNQLWPLTLQGRNVVSRKPPTSISYFGALEVLSGPPLGACAFRDPRLDVLARRLRWLVALANLPGLVGTLHRLLASGSGTAWVEPTASLAAALAELQWTLGRNPSSTRAQHWPLLEPEPSFSGEVYLEPQEDAVPDGAAWTDGSVVASGGGAALFQMSTNRRILCHMESPRSSTHCELVALTLAAQIAPPPPRILTDSLCALQLLLSWGRRSPRAVLACPERDIIRQFLASWEGSPHPPVLEKVKAHDTAAQRAGMVKSIGNEVADSLAKAAAAGVPTRHVPDPRFADAVLLRDASGAVIFDVASAVPQHWWALRRREGVQRRAWLGQLYPDAMDFDWKASTRPFMPPTVSGGEFVYAAPAAALKWTARVRSGGLATRARLAGTGRITSAHCLCCTTPVEDDAHAISGCSGTGASDCLLTFSRCWDGALAARGVQASVPFPSAWASAHLLQLAAGLIPRSLYSHFAAVSSWLVPVLLRDLQQGMMSRLAEVLRRREVLMAAANPPSAAPSPARVLPGVDAVRQLTVADYRAAESHPAPPATPPVRARGSHATVAPRVEVTLALPAWVKQHKFLRAAPLAHGEPSVALLLLWESDHGKLFPCRTTDLAGRLTTFSKQLQDAVAVDPELSHWLEHRRMQFPLAAGLPSRGHLRWAVRIDPSIGDPFLQTWKAHLMELVRQQQAGPAAAPVSNRGRRKPQTTTPSSPRPAAKRKRSATALPPSHSQAARLERLTKARRLAQASSVSASSSSSSSSSSTSPWTSGPPVPGAGPGLPPPGVIT